MTPHYFLLLQINDALFPIGSYTQSYGLETYVQQEKVRDTATAEALLLAQLRHNIPYCELLPLKIGYELAKKGDISTLMTLEQLSKVARVPREMREASLKLGNRFVRTVEGLPVRFDMRDFLEYKNACKGIGLSYPVAYGVYCGVAEMEIEEVLSSFLYSQVSAYVTNCVKLVPLSQTEGQKMLCRVQEEFTFLVEKTLALGWEDLFLSSPMFDLRSMQHERLYSRLYMS